MSDNIQVAIRVRQLIQKENQAGLKSNWTVEENSIYCNDESVCGKKPTVYKFDHIFDETSVTLDIFEEICKPILLASLNGFNGTIFAYGQSSSGKTHTITGSASHPGVIPLAVDEIFDQINQIQHKEFLIRVSYLEMYNEKLSDLLADIETNLKLQEDTERNIKIVGLSEEVISEKSQVARLLKKGNARRHTAETKQNDRSSRSHSILRFVIESRMIGEDEDKAVNVSNLFFVDLAGSEKAGENSGDRLREGCSINKSLFTLGNIIRKLSGDESAQHYSTRDSKLTRILQNSLGGNSKTAIICTITPAHIEESDSTLKFASRAKTIKNDAHINEVLDDAALMMRYRKKIKSLEKQIKEGGDGELAKKLKEKEDMIEKLRNMIVISGPVQTEEPALKKRRRETWAPGRLGKPVIQSLSQTNAFNLAPLNIEEPILEEEEEPAEMVPLDESSAQSPPSVHIGGFNTTMQFENQDLKELYELQDAHELLRDEFHKKQSELESLREFRYLETQMQDGTIKELSEKIREFEEGARWLEDEYMKAKQESTSLKHKLESMNRQLKSVEDGSGLSEKCEQLSDAEKKIEELNSEMEIQKSRYEFHIDQLKANVENLTSMLEQNGVDCDSIKKKLSSQPETSDDITKLKIEHEARVFELQQEIHELDDRYNLALEDQRNRFQKDIEDRDEEVEVYRRLLNEETTKSNKTEEEIVELKNELEKIKIENEETILNLHSELEQYKKMSEVGQTANEIQAVDLQTELLRSEIDKVKATYEEEISEWKQKYEQVLVEKTPGSNGLSSLQTEMLSAELDSLKTMHEDEIKTLKEENKCLTEKLENLGAPESPKHDQNAVSKLKEYYENQVKELQLCLEEKEKFYQSHAHKIESDETNSAVLREEVEKLKCEYEEKLNSQRDQLESLNEKLKEKSFDSSNITSDIESAKVNEIKENYEKQIEEFRSSLKVKYENELCELKSGIENKDIPDEKLDVNEVLIEELKSIIVEHEEKISQYETQVIELKSEITKLSEKLWERDGKSETINEESESVVKNLCMNDSSKINNESEIAKYLETITQLEGEINILKSGRDVDKSNKIIEEIQNEMKDMRTDYESKLIELQNYERLYKEHVEKLSQSTGTEGKSLQDELMELGTGVVKGCFGGQPNMMVSFDEDPDLSVSLSEKKSDRVVKRVQFQEETMEIDVDGVRHQSSLDQCTDCKEKEETCRMYETTMKEAQEELTLFRETVGELKEEIEQLHRRNRTLKQEKLELINAKAEMENLGQKQDKEPVEGITTVDEVQVEMERKMNNLREESEKEVQDLKDELGKLAESLEEMEEHKNRVDELQSANNELQIVNNEQQSVNNELQRVNDELQEKLSSLENKQQLLSMYEEQIEEFKQILKVEEEHYAELQSKCAKLEAELLIEKEKKTDNDIINDKLEKITCESNHDAELIEEYKLSLKEAEEQYAELKAKYTQLEVELGERENKSDYDDLKEKLEILTSENKQKTELVEEYKTSLSQEEKISSELQAKITELEEKLMLELESKSDYDDIKTQLDKYTSESNLNTELIEEYKLSLKEKEEHYSELQTEYTKLDEELQLEKESKSDYDDIKEKLEMLTSENSQSSELVEEYKTRLSKEEKISSEFQSQCAELEEKLMLEKESKSDYDDIKNQLDKHISESNLNLELIEEYKLSLKEVEEHYTELQTKYTELDDELKLEKECKSDYDDIKEKLETLIAENNQNAELVEEYKISLRQEEKINSELQAKCAGLEEKLMLEKESKSDYNNIKENLDKHSSESSENAELLEKYKLSLFEAEEHYAELQAKYTELGEELRVEKESKSDLDELIEEYKMSLKEEEERYYELKSKCEQLEEEITAEKESKSDIRYIKDSIEKLTFEKSHNAKIIQEYEKEKCETQEKLEKLLCENTLNAELIEEYKKEKCETQENLEKFMCENTLNAELIEEYKKEKCELNDKLEKLTYENKCNEELIEDYKKQISQIQVGSTSEEKCQSCEIIKTQLERDLNEIKDKLETARHEISRLEKEKQEPIEMIDVYKLQKLKEKMLHHDEKAETGNGETINQYKMELSEKEKEINTLEARIQSLEEALVLPSLDLPPGDLQYHSKSENLKWETQWEDLVKVEKRKRYRMAREIADLRGRLKNSEKDQKEGVDIIFENIKLHDENYKLKEAIKALEEKESSVVTEEKNKKPQTSGFITEEHSCKFRQDLVHLKTEHFKIQQELETKKSDIDAMHERYQREVSKLKNEIRRRNDLETTFEVGKMAQPKFTEEKPKEVESKASDKASGGIIDHLNACLLDAENKRLKKELEKANKALSSVGRRTNEIANKENLSEDNGTPSKLKEPKESELISSSGSLERHALGEMTTKASTQKTVSDQAQVSTAQEKEELKFDISDLFKKPEEPNFYKKPVSKKPIFDKDKDKEKDNCKTS